MMNAILLFAGIWIIVAAMGLVLYAVLVAAADRRAARVAAKLRHPSNYIAHGPVDDHTDSTGR